MAIEGLTARLLLDEDLDVAIAAALRRLGYDATHVCDLGRQGFGDEEQLRFAAERGCVLVTHNRNDFLELAAAWWGKQNHTGIVYARRATVGELVRRLTILLDTMSAEELLDVIVPLEAFG